MLALLWLCLALEQDFLLLLLEPPHRLCCVSCWLLTDAQINIDSMATKYIINTHIQEEEWYEHANQSYNFHLLSPPT